MLRFFYFACLDQCNTSIAPLYFAKQHCTELGRMMGDGGSAIIAICRRREQISQPATHSLMNKVSDPAFMFYSKRLLHHTGHAAQRQSGICVRLQSGALVFHIQGVPQSHSFSLCIPAPRLPVDFPVSMSFYFFLIYKGGLEVCLCLTCKHTHSWYQL